MKKLKYLAFAIMAICLAACGSKKESDVASSDSVTLQIEENNIGEFSKYGTFSGEVTLKKKSDSAYVVSIPFTISKDIAWKFNLDFELNVLDADHSIIASIGYLDIDGETDLDNGEFNTYILKGEHRQEVRLVVSADKWKEIKEKGKFLEIKGNTEAENISAYTKSDDSESVSSDDSSDSNESMSSDSGDENWDEVLDSFDEYVTNYISCMKKAKQGDMQAVSECSEIMNEAKELSDKLKNARGEMSSAQQARYLKILSKMTKAASNM